jgi:glycosyltransferase involved in cell wall biosynthesis
LLVDPLNPKAIADAMRWIMDHPAEAEAMGQRGRRAVEHTYNWDAEATKLTGLYNKLLAS